MGGGVKELGELRFNRGIGPHLAWFPNDRNDGSMLNVTLTKRVSERSSDP